MSEPNTWTESLPPDVREWDEVKNSDAPEKFWDQMVNMRSRMGQSIRVPSSDAGESDWQEFHRKLQEKVPTLMPTPNFEDDAALAPLYERMGRPKEAKDYKPPKFLNSRGEELPDYGKDFVESFKETAFKMGLSQKKYEEALSAILGKSIQANEQAQELHKADLAKLTQEWGAAYDRNTTIVANFLAQTGAPQAVVDAIKASTADSTTMVWLHNLATKTLGTNGTFQMDNSTRTVMTPDEATLKISEIRNNKQHPYNNPRDPGHAAARKYMRELYLLKNPTTGSKPAPATTFDVGGVQ